MTLRTTSDGWVLYPSEDHASPYPSITRTVWLRAMAESYSNDALCPNCQREQRNGYLLRYESRVLYEHQTLKARQVFCERCGFSVVRVPVDGKTHYFGHMLQVTP